MIVIVDNVTAKNDEGDDEVILKTAKGFERDIKDLLRCAQASKFLLRDDSSLIANYAAAL